MKKQKFSQRRKAAGATLVEVLVSILVLSIGLMGTAGLLVNSMRAVSETGNSTGASTYARELSELMMANRNIALSTVNNPYLFDSTTGWPASTVDCKTNACTAADRALWDVSEWSKRVQNAGSTGTGGIPGAKVRVCFDSLTANAGTAFQWNCSPGPNAPLVVKVAWASRDATGQVENTTAAAPVPRAVFVVTAGAGS